MTKNQTKLIKLFKMSSRLDTVASLACGWRLPMILHTIVRQWNTFSLISSQNKLFDL